MSNALIEISRWLFLGVLFFAPWIYGCTQPWAIRALDLALAIVLLLWLDGCVFRRSRPAAHRVAVWGVALLLCQGWWMACNPHFMHNAADHTFFPVAGLLHWAPGTVDRGVSVALMLRVTAMLGAILFAADLAAASPLWRQRMFQTIGLAGASVTMLGLLQRASGAHMIFWGERVGTTPFFATFYYAGNAGAFINLALLPVAAQAVLAIRDPDAHLRRALWIPGWLACLAGVFVNTSRVAQMIACGLTVVFLIAQARSAVRGHWIPRPAVLASYVAVVVVALAGLVVFTGWERSSEKWSLFPSQLSADNPRWLAMRATLGMLPDAGLMGLGPGTFEIAFPHYTSFLGDSIAGTWRYAHEDYLQAVVEWGWLGAAVASVLFFGGIFRCFARWKAEPKTEPLKNGNGAAHSPRRTRTRDRLLLFCAGLSLVGVALHALVDFPLQIASLQLYVSVFLGMGWSSSASPAPRATVP